MKLISRNFFWGIVFLFLCISANAKENRGVRNNDGIVRAKRAAKGDDGIIQESSRMHRRKRSIQGAGLKGIGDTVVSPTYHASYFVGQCYMCPPGPPGPPGPQGIRGRDGRDALFVQVGHSETGSQQSPGYPSRHTASQEPRRNESGTTYVRWGKSSCPATAELVYEGVAAGGYHNSKGGGTNFLCLPEEPIFDRPVAGANGGAQLYGTEYQIDGFFPPFNHLHDSAVPCALCLAPSRGHTLMIPGRNVCPEGKDWTLEYYGWIMTAHKSHFRTDHLCVDHEAEGLPRTAGNQNEALLYVAEISCDANTGIPCPPYTIGYEITCAVCTL